MLRRGPVRVVILVLVLIIGRIKVVVLVLVVLIVSGPVGVGVVGPLRGQVNVRAVSTERRGLRGRRVVEVGSLYVVTIRVGIPLLIQEALGEVLNPASVVVIVVIRIRGHVVGGGRDEKVVAKLIVDDGARIRVVAHSHVRLGVDGIGAVAELDYEVALILNEGEAVAVPGVLVAVAEDGAVLDPEGRVVPHRHLCVHLEGAVVVHLGGNVGAIAKIVVNVVILIVVGVLLLLSHGDIFVRKRYGLRGFMG